MIVRKGRGGRYVRVFYFAFFKIHRIKCDTLVYTPGNCPLPHPIPHDTIPTCVQRPMFTIKGPPLSPYNISAMLLVLNYILIKFDYIISVFIFYLPQNESV